MLVLRCVPEIPCPLPSRFIHVDGEEAKCSSGALRLQRAWSTLGTSPDVSKRAVPDIASAVIQLLTCWAEIAVALRLVCEALRAEQRTPCPSHSIAHGHVWRNLSVHQPLQQLTIAVAGIGNDGLRILTPPLAEASDHLLGSSGFLAEAGTRRLHADDDATVIIYQVVVVIAHPRW